MLVIGKDHHVLVLIANLLREVGNHITHIINTAAKLAALVKIVNTNQQGFPPAYIVGVSEGIAIEAIVAKLLRC